MMTAHNIDHIRIVRFLIFWLYSTTPSYSLYRETNWVSVYISFCYALFIRAQRYYSRGGGGPFSLYTQKKLRERERKNYIHVIRRRASGAEEMMATFDTEMMEALFSMSSPFPC